MKLPSTLFPVLVLLSSFLLPAVCQGQGGVKEPTDYIVIADLSGSMDKSAALEDEQTGNLAKPTTRLENLKKALRRQVPTWAGQDKRTPNNPSKVYFYHFDAGTYAPEIQQLNRSGQTKIEREIQGLKTDLRPSHYSGTAIVDALTKAIREVEKKSRQAGRGGPRAYILFSDGGESEKKEQINFNTRFYDFLKEWAENLETAGRHADTLYFYHIGPMDETATKLKQIIDKLHLDHPRIKFSKVAPKVGDIIGALQKPVLEMWLSNKDIPITTEGTFLKGNKKYKKGVAELLVSLEGRYLPKEMPSGLGGIQVRMAPKPHEYFSHSAPEGLLLTRSEWAKLHNGDVVTKTLELKFEPPEEVNIGEEEGQIRVSFSVPPDWEIKVPTQAVRVTVTSAGRAEVNLKIPTLEWREMGRIDDRKGEFGGPLKGPKTLSITAFPAVTEPVGKGKKPGEVSVHFEDTYPPGLVFTLTLNGKEITDKTSEPLRIDLNNKNQKFRVEVGPTGKEIDVGGNIVFTAKHCQLSGLPSKNKVSWKVVGDEIPPSDVTVSGGLVEQDPFNLGDKDDPGLANKVKFTTSFTLDATGEAGRKGYQISLKNQSFPANPVTATFKQGEKSIREDEFIDKLNGTIDFEVEIGPKAVPRTYKGVITLKIKGKAQLKRAKVSKLVDELTFIWAAKVNKLDPPVITVSIPEKKCETPPIPLGEALQYKFPVKLDFGARTERCVVDIRVHPLDFVNRTNQIPWFRDKKLQFVELWVPRGFPGPGESSTKKLTLLFTTECGAKFNTPDALETTRSSESIDIELEVIRLKPPPDPTPLVEILKPVLERGEVVAKKEWKEVEGIGSRKIKVPFEVRFNSDAKKAGAKVDIEFAGETRTLESGDQEEGETLSGEFVVTLNKPEIIKSGKIEFTASGAKFKKSAKPGRSMPCKAQITKIEPHVWVQLYPDDVVREKAEGELEYLSSESEFKSYKFTQEVGLEWSNAARWLGEKKPYTLKFTRKDRPDDAPVTAGLKNNKLNLSFEHPAGNSNETDESLEIVWEVEGVPKVKRDNEEIEEFIMSYTIPRVPPPFSVIFMEKLVFPGIPLLVLAVALFFGYKKLRHKYGPATFPGKAYIEAETPDAEIVTIDLGGLEEVTLGEGTEHLPDLPLSITLKAVKTPDGDRGCLVEWSSENSTVSCTKRDVMGDGKPFLSGGLAVAGEELEFEVDGAKVLTITLHGEFSDDTGGFDEDDIGGDPFGSDDGLGDMDDFDDDGLGDEDLGDMDEFDDDLDE